MMKDASSFKWQWVLFGCIIIFMFAGIYWSMNSYLYTYETPEFFGENNSILEQEATPTDDDWPPRIESSRVSPHLPIDHWVSEAEIIAEVEVVDIDDVRFNTQNGSMPTPDPLGTNDGLDLFSPVTLRVVQYYKTDIERDGFVVPMEGGEFDGHVHWFEPDKMFEPVGSRGIIFLRYVPEASPDSTADEWIDHLESVVDELNIGGDDYAAARWVTFYRFFDDPNYEGLAGSAIDYTTILQEDLIDGINASLQHP